MSYLGSRIAAPVSHPQGLTLWPDLTLFSSTESRPPWRELNPCPTELKMVTLLTMPRDLVEKALSVGVVYISYTYVSSTSTLVVHWPCKHLCVSCIYYNVLTLNRKFIRYLITDSMHICSRHTPNLIWAVPAIPYILRGLTDLPLLRYVSC